MEKLRSKGRASLAPGYLPLPHRRQSDGSAFPAAGSRSQFSLELFHAGIAAFAPYRQRAHDLLVSVTASSATALGRPNN
jgi:hypothetical protein